MFSIREMIDSGFLWLFTVCVLPLCLTVPGLRTENPAARADDMHPSSISKSVDTPEALIPPPPPPPPTY